MKDPQQQRLLSRHVELVDGAGHERLRRRLVGAVSVYLLAFVVVAHLVRLREAKLWPLPQYVLARGARHDERRGVASLGCEREQIAGLVGLSAVAPGGYSRQRRGRV